ncbi:MAG: GIY-YIG nuclease family protein [Chitinophagaceae bacterium]|nr:MAG: GIY-YIG nuclease family protein [Chitinophagaceae bacterium]
MLYTVYILYSKKQNKTYVGFTSNLLQRFKSHNDLGRGFTARYRPWTIIYCEYFMEKAAAMKRERELKGGKGRAWIQNKILVELEHKGFISA